MRVRDVVLVGESNPFGEDLRFALYHFPRGCSGDRLREHLGLSDSAYEKIQKTHLCAGAWSGRAARLRAQALLGLSDFRVFVLLGGKVRAAFRGPPIFERAVDGQLTLVTIPHPSGRNLLWNDPAARQRARDLLRPYLPEIP